MGAFHSIPKPLRHMMTLEIHLLGVKSFLMSFLSFAMNSRLPMVLKELCRKLPGKANLHSGCYETSFLVLLCEHLHFSHLHHYKGWKDLAGKWFLGP